jgi:hypothetical protein
MTNGPYAATMTERRRHVRESESPRRGKAPWIALLAVVIVAAGVWAAILLLDRGPKTTILENGSIYIVGEGNATTDTFEVREAWHIDWSSEGPRFSFAITGDRDFGTIVDEEGEISGITNPVGTGRFALEITAEGPWEITIFPGVG